MEKQFSIIRALRLRSAGNPVYDKELIVLNAGKAEMRKANIIDVNPNAFVLPLQTRSIIASGTATSGKEGVSTDTLGLVESLKNALILTKAGAIFMPGLIGDVSIPVYSGSNATWKGETASADDGAGTTSEVNMSPKRLTSYLDISLLFLNQSVAGSEELLIQEIINSVSQKLESTILGAEAGSVTKPAGLFYNAPSLGAVDFKKIVSLETSQPKQTAKYLTCAGGRGLLKTTSIGQGQMILGKDGEANGYPVLTSNAVAKNLGDLSDEFGICFGDFENLIIGSWGGLELIIDNVTQAVNGCVRLTINSYFDSAITNPAYFNFASIK